MQSFFSNKKAIAIFVLPSLLLFTIIVFYPLVQIFIKSFYDWNGLSSGTFIGIENYVRLFDDTTFRISIINGLIFAAFLTIYQIGLGTILAFAASNIKTKAGGFFRIVYFLPVVLSVTVVCQLWLSVFNAEYGLLNKIFEIFGMSFSQDWLSDGNTAIYVVAFVNAWHYLGYQFALILAGIKSIPGHYYEAAQIDGASPLQAHLRITLPMLAETYRFCLVLAITGGLNAFTQMFIMTGGGPGTATYSLTYMMYSSSFRAGEYGYGMAAASFLVIECLIATIVINKLMAREKIVY